jgi:glycine/D-amino acid oxidase-like deaminating enzyme
LRIEVLSREAIEERYPTLRLLRSEAGTFEADGGVLKPERAIAAHLKLAESRGAQTRFETTMQSWDGGPNGFELALSDGSSVTARALVLSLGPWFLEKGIPLRVQRNVQVWFTPITNAYDAQRFPGFLLDRVGLPAALYGFPDFGDGVKAAFHGHGDFTAPPDLIREVDGARDVEPVARVLDEWMPGAADEFREAKACMYALTPDHHFVIDRHPQHERLIVCGGFSGHGFKFAPVVGEIAAALALDGRSEHEIGFLSGRRFPAFAQVR